MAASLVTDAAMNGELEVRGRPSNGISYEVIPREAWRLIALDTRPDLHTLWRVMVIPRAGAAISDDGKLETEPPSRVAHIFDYDSLIVDSCQFQQLWPRKDPIADRARKRCLQKAARKGVVNREFIRRQRH
jgi:hypothetical protein